MFDFSFSSILHSNLFNFILLVLILYHLLAPVIKKMIEQNTEKTSNIVNDSISTRDNAIQNLEKTKEDYAKTPQEIKEINSIAENTLDSLKKKSEEDTELSKNIIEENSVKSVNSESARIMSVLTKETVEDSVETARADIINRLKNEDGLADKLIEQAIDNLETV